MKYWRCRYVLGPLRWPQFHCSFAQLRWLQVCFQVQFKGWLTTFEALCCRLPWPRNSSWQGAGQKVSFCQGSCPLEHPLLHPHPHQGYLRLLGKVSRVGAALIPGIQWSKGEICTHPADLPQGPEDLLLPVGLGPKGGAPFWRRLLD